MKPEEIIGVLIVCIVFPLTLNAGIVLASAVGTIICINLYKKWTKKQKAISKRFTL